MPIQADTAFDATMTISMPKIERQAEVEIPARQSRFSPRRSFGPAAGLAFAVAAFALYMLGSGRFTLLAGLMELFVSRWGAIASIAAVLAGAAWIVARVILRSQASAIRRPEGAQRIPDLIEENCRLREERDYHRTAAAELIRQRDEASAAVRTQTECVASVCHEIRTPLNGILGMLELLSTTSLSEEQASYIQAAGTSGRMLRGLLGDILDLSRLESGKPAIRLAVFAPNEMMLELRQLLEPEASIRAIRLECKVTSLVPELLVGDPLRIQQVILNLATNAIKCTPSGSVMVTLGVNSSPGQSLLQVVVEDTGVGIPKSHLERIFEPFEQVEGFASGSSGGVGLGLTITRKLVEAMRGSVSVESEPGVGTTFVVSLPVDLPPETKATHSLAKLRAGVASPQEASSRLRAIVADDNPVNRFLLDRQLQKLGCHVLTCETGDEAYDTWYTQRPHLLFTDLNMPGRNGIELARAVRNAEAHVSTSESATPTMLVLVSAAQFAGTGVPLETADFDSSLAKPFRFEELARILELARSRAASTEAHRCEANAQPIRASRPSMNFDLATAGLEN
ncbi:MAG: ATP-binding protein [Bryobacterales bacterium]|nr:ATP-binding protein [Bryobacterales bacterium]